MLSAKFSSFCTKSPQHIFHESVNPQQISIQSVYLFVILYPLFLVRKIFNEKEILLMKTFKVFINGKSAKCAEIATELSAFGINAVIRPDFSGKTTAELCAVIIDKSNEDLSEKPAVNVGSSVKTFVLTNTENPLISEEKGVLYVPAKLPTESIVNLVRQGIGAVADLRKTVSQFLIKMGFPTHMKGYLYTVEAVAMIIENPVHIGRFQYEIYPEIAKKFGVTTCSVERAIRTLIKGTYERHEIGYFRQFFGYAIQKPTNTEFITLCAEKIKTEIL